MHKIEENKRQAELYNRRVIEKLKVGYMVAERDVMKTLNPKDILIKAKLNLTL